MIFVGSQNHKQYKIPRPQFFQGIDVGTLKRNYKDDYTESKLYVHMFSKALENICRVHYDRVKVISLAPKQTKTAFWDFLGCCSSCCISFCGKLCGSFKTLNKAVQTHYHCL